MAAKKLLVLAALMAAPAVYAPIAYGQTAPSIYTIGGLESEETRLARSNFAPIGEVAAQKRTVRRASFRDPFDTPTAPSVVLEKTAAGEFAFAVTAEGKVRKEGKLTADEWKSVVALDPALAAPRIAASPAKAQPCVGKFIVIEATEGGKARRREASPCGGAADLKALAYSFRIAEVVLAHMPECEPYADGEFNNQSREASWVLAECMKPRGRRINSRGPARAE